MPIATGLALGIGAGVAAAGSVASGALGAHAAGQAADAQTAAANHAADLQKQEADQSLAFQQQVYQQGQQNQAPFLQAGQHAVTSLNDLMGLQKETPYANPNAQPARPTLPPMNQKQIGLLIGRAHGGPAKKGNTYIVGEREPEILKMHKDGSGMVIPLSKLSGSVSGIARFQGGPVDYRTGAINGGRTSTLSAGPPPMQASTGGRPANSPQQSYGASGPAANPFGAQSNNPLITGGSSKPIQSTPFTQWSQQFQAPTGAQAAQDPGYQFQFQQGQDAILNNASALGTTGSGATGAALEKYGQGMAQGAYQDVYNRALQQYDQNYNIFSQNQGNEFNRLSSLAGGGQTSVGQLNALGQSAAGNVSGINSNYANQAGQAYQNAGAAQGSRYVGGANAWGGGLSNIGNLGQLAYLQKYMGNQSSGAGSPGYSYGYGMSNS